MGYIDAIAAQLFSQRRQASLINRALSLRNIGGPLVNDGKAAEAAIIMPSLPFAVVGGLWLIWLMSHDVSVPTLIGFVRGFQGRQRDAVLGDLTQDHLSGVACALQRHRRMVANRPRLPSPALACPRPQVTVNVFLPPGSTRSAKPGTVESPASTTMV